MKTKLSIRLGAVIYSLCLVIFIPGFSCAGTNEMKTIAVNAGATLVRSLMHSIIWSSNKDGESLQNDMQSNLKRSAADAVDSSLYYYSNRLRNDYYGRQKRAHRRD